MRKQIVVALVLGCLAGPAHGQAVLPEIVNAGIAYMPAVDCRPGHALYQRSAQGGCREPGYPNEVDICDDYEFYGRPVMGWGLDFWGNHVAGVGGMNWPAGAGSAVFPTRPWAVLAYGPGDPNRPCVDAVKLVSHPTEDIKGSGYSFLIWDMKQYLGCQVEQATLRFNVVPWFSGSAQPDETVTAKMGVFDIRHSGENSLLRPKGSCRGDLVADARNNPVTFEFPIPMWQNYQERRVDVAESVRADLNDPDATGFVGLLLASRDFGAENMDAAQGVRGITMGEFVLEVELGTCGPPPRPDSSTVLDCATLLLDALTLRIPCLDLGVSAWIDLRLSNTERLEFTVADLGLSGGGASCATYDPLSGMVHISCLLLDCASYWLDLELVETQPITLRIVNVGLNPAASLRGNDPPGPWPPGPLQWAQKQGLGLSRSDCLR